MTHPLAVCVPVVGQPSETFIHRHVTGLVPGGTVVIARRTALPGPANWTTDVPTLWLDDLADEWGGAAEQAAVAEFLQAHGVRSVLVEYLDVWLPNLATFAAGGRRCFAHAHGYDVSMRLRDEYWRSSYRAYNDIDGVITMSTYSRDRLIGIGLTPERIHVVPCGVDVAPRRTNRPVPGHMRVLAVGRLVAKKNPLATLDACAAAARGGADIQVTVIGDGPLRQELIAMSQRMTVPVELTGAMPHQAVLTAMQSADVFCQHSVTDPDTGDEEGVPVAILEAMAHGLPVASTRHAGIPEAVIDGVTGLLVDEGDVDGMAEHLHVLATDPELRQRLGAAARERIRAEFSWAGERSELRQLLQVDPAEIRADKESAR